MTSTIKKFNKHFTTPVFLQINSNKEDLYSAEDDYETVLVATWIQCAEFKINGVFYKRQIYQQPNLILFEILKFLGKDNTIEYNIFWNLCDNQEKEFYNKVQNEKKQIYEYIIDSEEYEDENLSHKNTKKIIDEIYDEYWDEEEEFYDENQDLVKYNIPRKFLPIS